VSFAIINAIKVMSKGEFMTALSIRNLDEQALQRLKAEAAEQGSSVNTLVVRLIETATGVRTAARTRTEHHDLDALSGTWSDDEAAAFNAAIAVFEQPDAGLWR
jgi:plasmid stability protein